MTLPVDEAQRARLRRIYETPMGLLTDDEVAEMNAFMAVATDAEIHAVLDDDGISA